jgi:hypothetical protein
MNKNQKKVIIVGLVLIVLMGLFPPWIHTFNVKAVNIERAGNYGFMFSPPPPERNLSFLNEKLWGVRLDVSRLLIQWILVVVIVCGLVVLLKKDNVREA